MSSQHCSDYLNSVTALGESIDGRPQTELSSRALHSLELRPVLSCQDSLLNEVAGHLER